MKPFTLKMIIYMVITIAVVAIEIYIWQQSHAAPVTVTSTVSQAANQK